MTHHIGEEPELVESDTHARTCRCNDCEEDRGEDYLEPELDDALDAFMDGWKAKVRGRLVMGEKEYQGKWLEMTEKEIAAELMDEVLDMIGYAVFLRYKTENV